MISVKEKEKKSFGILKEKFNYTNPFAAPRLVKVVVASGTGKLSQSDKKRNEFVADRLAKITGQKAAPRGVKECTGFLIKCSMLLCRELEIFAVSHLTQLMKWVTLP